MTAYEDQAPGAGQMKGEDPTRHEDRQPQAQGSSHPDPGATQGHAGSLPSSEPVFLVVGRLHRPHGVKGEIIMSVLSDFPERLVRGAKVFVGEDHQPKRIRSSRPHGHGLLVAFDGIGDAETVGDFRNLYVYVNAADRPPLPEGEYYHHQLLGLRVVGDEGRSLGVLSNILDTGANDVYVVTQESGKEILLPAVASVVLDINLERGEMRVHLLPGLLPD